MLWISMKREKTSKDFSIPLLPRAGSLIIKYQSKQSMIFPKISNQKYNSYLKEIAAIIGINEAVKFTSSKGSHKKEEIKEKWEKIGSHTARRTYITIAAENNMPDHFIMAVTGIKDPNTLKKYKKINKDVILKYTKGMFLPS